jgi:hypothetical protein
VLQHTSVGASFTNGFAVGAGLPLSRLADDYEITDCEQRVDLARCSDRQLDAAV